MSLAPTPIEPRAAPELPDRAPATHWERVARTRWGSYISAVERRALLTAHALRPGPTDALEVGCEGGRWSEMLTDLGWRMTCTDVDAELLDLCRARLPEATCILVEPDSTTLPAADATVELLACIEVMQVVGEDWFVEEAARVMAPGGVMVGVFKNKLSVRGYLKHRSVSRTGGFDHYARSYPSWRKSLRRAGFRVVHQEGICWWPFHRASDSTLVPIATRVERLLGLRRLPAISPWIVVVAQRDSA